MPTTNGTREWPWHTAVLRLLRVDRYVVSLYREVLARDPTTEELADQLGRLKAWQIMENGAAILRGLLRSPQAGVALGVRLILNSMPPAGDVRQPFSTVVSLGTHCYTSAMLARQGLRRFSAPFDWLFSSVDMIAHCLEDDFRIFLDRGYYRPVPLELRRDGPEYNLCDHLYYLEHFQVRYVFNHTDPNTEQGYAYLERCVARLHAVLNSSDHKLFVCITSKAAYSSASLEQLAAVLGRRTQNAEIVCMVIYEPTPAAIMPAVEELNDVRGVRLYALRPISRIGGTRFEDAIDELPIARIIRGYAFSSDAQAPRRDPGFAG